MLSLYRFMYLKDDKPYTTNVWNKKLEQYLHEGQILEKIDEDRNHPTSTAAFKQYIKLPLVAIHNM